VRDRYSFADFNCTASQENILYLFFTRDEEKLFVSWTLDHSPTLLSKRPGLARRARFRSLLRPLPLGSPRSAEGSPTCANTRSAARSQCAACCVKAVP